MRLRERFWLEVIAEAACQGRSLIFTFAPEPSVAEDFPERVQSLVESHGGQTLFVALTLDRVEQEHRLVAEDRAVFGKLRSPELLRALHGEFERCMAAMPAPALAIDTGSTSPEQAAEHIAHLL